MSLLGRFVQGVASLHQAYLVGRDITLTAAGGVRIVTDALAASAAAFALRRGGVNVLTFRADGAGLAVPAGTEFSFTQGSATSARVSTTGRWRVAAPGTVADVAIALANTLGNGLIATATTLSLVAAGAESVRASNGSTANGSQETDALLRRADGASPPVFSLQRVSWKDGASIGAGDKVLVIA